MKERYFDENAHELIMGVHINDVSQAAYKTQDPNDPILQPPMEGKAWAIDANGQLTLVDTMMSKEAWLADNALRYETALSQGVLVTGKFMVNGQVVDHKGYMRVDKTMQNNLNTIHTLASDDPNEPPTPLEVEPDKFIMVRTAAEAIALLRAGKNFVIRAQTVEFMARKLIRASTNTSYRRDLNTYITSWENVALDINLSTL